MHRIVERLGSGTWLTPERRDEPELMDAPGLPPDEVADAYRVLRRINGWFFGGRGPLRRELQTLLDATQRSGCPVSGSLNLVDVGSGSGDLASEARGAIEESGLSCAAWALDRDPVALRLARQGGVPALRADALRLPFGDQSIDIVLAVKFAHHFSGAELATLMSEMSRVARRAVVVLDIRRSWFAYGGFVLWSRVFTRNRLVRYDGPLSVLRGFTSDELKAVVSPHADFSWSVRRHPGFQLALIGRRRV